VRAWWNDEFDRDGARGVAIFVSGADGLWRVLPLPRPVRDDVHLGRRLRLTPLVELAGDGDGAFVAVVNRERGQVFRLRSGRLEAARPYLDRARAARVQETLERWRGERGKHGRASAGWAETLAAASDGRVELLLLGERAGQKAFRCPECGRAEAAGGRCPLDGAELEPDAAADCAVEQTLAQGGAVVNVRGGVLDDAEGVGALLR